MLNVDYHKSRKPYQKQGIRNCCRVLLILMLLYKDRLYIIYNIYIYIYCKLILTSTVTPAEWYVYARSSVVPFRSPIQIYRFTLTEWYVYSSVAPFAHRSRFTPTEWYIRIYLSGPFRSPRFTPTEWYIRVPILYAYT